MLGAVSFEIGTLVPTSTDARNVTNGDPLLGLFYLASLFVLYTIPTGVAFTREVPNVPGIAIVNLALGWTLAGCVVALVWAVSARTKHDLVAAEAKQIETIRRAERAAATFHCRGGSAFSVRYETMIPELAVIITTYIVVRMVELIANESRAGGRTALGIIAALAILIVVASCVRVVESGATLPVR